MLRQVIIVFAAIALSAPYLGYSAPSTASSEVTVVDHVPSVVVSDDDVVESGGDGGAGAGGSAAEETATDPVEPAAFIKRDYQENHGNKNLIVDEEPVKYDGAQLWRIQFDDVHDKNAVAELQHNFGNDLIGVGQEDCSAIFTNT